MIANTPVKIIECPRDAWQGLPRVIPTAEKVQYLRRLIDAGFRHIDAVSFVSPKHVPSMADSEQVMQALGETGVEIIGIVVNEKGMERALATPGVTTLGYPYSISAYFRRSNANMSREESRELVEKLQQATSTAGRDLVVYVSMAFGNPYEEPWGPEIVEDTLQWLRAVGVRTVSLADTVGTASPELVAMVYAAASKVAGDLELGVHLHSTPDNASAKVMTAYAAGCRRFDSALTGLGGCPFAGDELVGNIATEAVAGTLSAHGIDAGFDISKLAPVIEMTGEIRSRYAH